MHLRRIKEAGPMQWIRSTASAVLLMLLALGCLLAVGCEGDRIIVQAPDEAGPEIVGGLWALTQTVTDSDCAAQDPPVGVPVEETITVTVDGDSVTITLQGQEIVGTRDNGTISFPGFQFDTNGGTTTVDPFTVTIESETLLSGTLTFSWTDGVDTCGGTIGIVLVPTTEPEEVLRFTSALEHFVSDDGRGFNHRDAKINKGLTVFWNSANGHAIVLYLDEYERLWAHHFDGTNFTTGVELIGPGQRAATPSTDDSYDEFENFRVLFLSTADHEDANAQARDGDALILWLRSDEEPSSAGLDPDANMNDRLYGTYFDVSERDVVAGDEGVHHGFQTMATVIDFDNKVPGAAGDDDVTNFGFVSDSLKWTHVYDARLAASREFPNIRLQNASSHAIPPSTRSGDPTGMVFLVWRKGQRDGTSTVAERWHYLEFDLNQAGNALPAQASLGAGTVPPPTGVTLGEGSAVRMETVVHNDCMIWRGTTDTGAVGLFLSCFRAGLAPVTIELSGSIEEAAARPAAAPRSTWRPRRWTSTWRRTSARGSSRRSRHRRTR
jgi:hypothetical protein